LLVVIAVIAILVALLLPAVQAAREASRRARCASHFKQIGLALHNYQGAIGVFPPGMTNEPGVKNGHAWSVFILPYMENSALYESIDFNVAYWRPGSREAGTTAIPEYGCPSNPHEGAWVEGSSLFQQGATAVEDYRATCATGVADSQQWWGIFHPSGGINIPTTRGDGMLYANSATDFADVLDGTSETFFVGEMTGANGRHPSQGPAYFQQHWLSWNMKDTAGGINGPGTVPGGREDGPGGDPIDGDGNGTRRIQELFDEVGFSSFHPGGCHFLKVDGSVDFLSEDISADVIRSLTTRAGGETVDRH